MPKDKLIYEILTKKKKNIRNIMGSNWSAIKNRDVWLLEITLNWKKKEKKERFYVINNHWLCIENWLEWTRKKTKTMFKIVYKLAIQTHFFYQDKNKKKQKFHL